MRYPSIAVLATLALLTATAPVSAQYTWNGNGTTDNWTDAGNWTGGVPVSAASATVTFAGNTRLTPVQNIPSPPFLLNSLSFASGAGAFSLSGSGLDFRTNGATLPTFNQNSSSAIAVANSLVLTNNTTFGGTGSGGVTLDGALSGAGSLTKTGTWTLTLNAASSFGGGVNINRGTLRLGANGVLPSTANVTVSGVGGSSTLDLNGKLQTIGNLTFGDAAATGATNVTAGQLTLTGGTLAFEGNPSGMTAPVAIAANLVLNTTTTFSSLSGAPSNSPSIYDVVVTGRISGSGGLIKDSSTTFITLVLAGGPNTYTGATTVNSGGGALILGAVNALPRTSAVTINDFLVLDPTSTGQGVTAGSYDQRIGSLAGSSVGIVELGTAVLTTGFANTNTTFAGNISTNGTVVKVGTGSFTLSNFSQYTGRTLVEGGTLSLATSGRVTNNSAVSVAAGALLSLNNTASNVNNRLGAGTGVTLRGGMLELRGNATTATAQSAGILTLGSGQSSLSLIPGSGPGTQMTFASFVPGNTGTIFFEGSNLGSTPGTSVANVFFTAAPTLVGGGGAAGTATISILPSGFAPGLTGPVPITFVTYGANGIRELSTATEYATDLTTAGSTDNVRDASNRTLATATTRNSLILAGTGQSVGLTTAGQPLTLTSGALLSNGTGNQITGPGALQFGTGGTSTAYITVSNDLTVAAPVSAAHVAKSGTGTLTFANSVSSTGTVAVNAGTLRLLNDGTTTSGSVANAATIQISNGATLNVSGVTAGSGFQLGAGQTLQGNGAVVGSLRVGPNAVVAPTALPGPGTLAVESMVWLGGGAYQWSLNSITGGAFTQSHIAGSGSLDLSTLTAVNQFTIRLVSLKADNTAGNVSDFRGDTPLDWTLATMTGGFVNPGGGFSSSFFIVDRSQLSNTLPANSFFTVLETSNQLILHFEPTPEPASVLLLAFLTCVAGGTVRAGTRRLRQGPTA